MLATVLIDAFFGEQTDTGLKQFFGRGSRPGTNLLKQGDFGYKAIHLKSEFGSHVMGIESPSEKITRTNPALSDEIMAELDDLKKKMVAVNRPHRYSDIKLSTRRSSFWVTASSARMARLCSTDINAERAKYMPPEEEDEMFEQAVEEIDDGKPSDEQDEDDEHDAEGGEKEDAERATRTTRTRTTIAVNPPLG